MLKYRDYYVTSKEAALMLGFSVAHIRRLIIEGKIKAEKLNSNWIIAKKDLINIRRKRFKREE